MFLTRISINHPVFTTMMMVVLLVFGVFSYDRLGLNQFPNVDVPVVVVSVQYSGATPEIVETEITRPIEEAIGTISSIDEVTSTSYEGRSVVIASFELDVESRSAAQDVRDKVAALEAKLPRNAEKPIVSRYNPSDEPVLSIAVTSRSLDIPNLTMLVDQRILRQLTAISGVGQAIVVGGRKQQIKVALNEQRLRAFGVGANEVVTALKASGQAMPGGAVTDSFTERTVQIEGGRDSVESLQGIVVVRRGGGPVHIRDLASIALEPEEHENLAIYNGKPALAIDIVKVQDANTVQVVADIKQRLQRINAELARQDVQLDVVRDASKPIIESLTEVQMTLVEGAALAIAIVFVFLNSWRSTVITGLTLPISMIGTLAVIDFLGFTLNTLSLLGLTLSIGILVDDAIVVRENITRHLHMGKSHRQAAFDGTNEIGLAVVATTATIVAVFLPVAFMDGMVGRFFFEFGVTVSAAVLISLFVAFTLDPMLSSVWHDPDAAPDARRGPVGRVIGYFDQGFDVLVLSYRRLISFTLRHRLITLLLTSGIFVASAFMVPLVGVQFIPDADQGRFQINLTTPAGSSLEYTRSKVAQVEHALLEFPETASVYATINTDNSRGKHRANILVQLLPQAHRTRSPIMMAEPVRERLRFIPGIEMQVIQDSLGGAGESPIQLRIRGEDLGVLKQIAADVMEGMRQIPGVVDINSSSSESKAVLSVRLKQEQASDLGIRIQDLTSVLLPLIGGEEVFTWTERDGTTRDIVVRLPSDQRADVETINQLPLAVLGTDNSAVPTILRIDQVARVDQIPGATEIKRANQSREIVVSADATLGNNEHIEADLQNLVASQQVPPDYEIKFGGDAEDIGKAVSSMLKALIMAVIFIYVVLASQFGSFSQPIAIMAALPLSLIGVLVGLLATGSSINMFSMIGFVMLMGLVTKNGILRIDFANRRHQDGVALEQALMEAGSVRFRPIVMTTLAMVFGMLPLAFATSGGGAQRAPMAHAVIGGLISSTILTLIVIPVIVMSLDAAKARYCNFASRNSHQRQGSDCTTRYS